MSDNDKYNFKENALSFVLECNENNGTYTVSDRYGLRGCYGNDAYYQVALVQKSCDTQDESEGFGFYDESESTEKFDGGQYQSDQKRTIYLSADGKKEDTYPTIQGIVEWAFGTAKMNKTPFVVQFIVPQVRPDPLDNPQKPRNVMLPHVAYEFVIDANEIGFITNEDQRKFDLSVEAGLFVQEAKKFEKDIDGAIWEARALNKNRLTHYTQNV